MRRSLLLLLCLVFALAGCKAKELAEKAAISKDLDKRGTTDLMQEISNDKYDPPADGRLTEAQIQMYMKVQEHTKKIVQVAKEEMQQHADEAKKNEKSLSGFMQGMKALGSAADLLTADLRAAKDLGFNTAEYSWVKEQLMTARAAQVSEQMSQAITANFDKAYQEAKKGYDEAKDDQTKQMYAQMLAGYDKSKQEMQQQSQNEDPAVAYNRQLAAKYGDQLDALANELSKWQQDKPAEAKKP